ncbi:MAG TPA: gamma-butyrobetaine hydroxylase-like domain-containing protein [Rhizomicrobium sp.]
MSGAATRPWPTEIRLNPAKTQLTVEFDSGERFVLPAEYLRVESPSAEVQGHGAGQKQIITGKADVAILGLEPVGNYAVRIKFDDGHDTGLFS